MEPLEKFFERYSEGMARMTRVADLDSFFRVPCLFITADGRVLCQHTIEDVRAFTTTRFEMFWKEKITQWKLRSFDATTVGPAASLVSVNWETRKDDGTLVLAWRHYYMLTPTPEGWKIVMATFQS